MNICTNDIYEIRSHVNHKGQVSTVSRNVQMYCELVPKFIDCLVPQLIGTIKVKNNEGFNNRASALARQWSSIAKEIW